MHRLGGVFTHRENFDSAEGLEFPTRFTAAASTNSNAALAIWVTARTASGSPPIGRGRTPQRKKRTQCAEDEPKSQPTCVLCGLTETRITPRTTSRPSWLTGPRESSSSESVGWAIDMRPGPRRAHVEKIDPWNTGTSGTPSRGQHGRSTMSRRLGDCRVRIAIAEYDEEPTGFIPGQRPHQPQGSPITVTTALFRWTYWAQPNTPPRMRLLVVGARQVDAGKTTFTRGLAAVTGVRVGKPRGANDLWHHHDAYRRAIDAGRLYGKDARSLADELDIDVAPEAINPIHRLWGPVADPAGGMHGRAHRQFLVDRVGDTFVVNGNADLPRELTAALPLEDAPRVDSIGAINQLIEDRYLPTLERWERRQARHEGLIIESYSDIAMPVQTVTFDHVAVVEPGRVRVFRGDRYASACEAVSPAPREGTMEPTVGNVIADLTPVGEAELPPLPAPDRERSARIARAYREAYELLLNERPAPQR